MKKHALRPLYLQKRSLLTDHDLQTANQRICTNLFHAIDFTEVKVVHLFLSIEKNKEPDTSLIIQKLTTTHPNIKISIPKISTHGSMEHFYYEGPEQLKPNILNIPEPTHGVPTSIQDIDLVLVPLLIFDQSGHRVGYGKGFYDRFLTQCRNDTKRIGISLFEPIEKIEDTNQHDIALTHCVTPQNVYLF
jgi:5-formyltetrahydrofolate cyclo-ligase